MILKNDIGNICHLYWKLNFICFLWMYYRYYKGIVHFLLLFAHLYSMVLYDLRAYYQSLDLICIYMNYFGIFDLILTKSQFSAFCQNIFFYLIFFFYNIFKYISQSLISICKMCSFDTFRFFEGVHILFHLFKFFMGKKGLVL